MELDNAGSRRTCVRPSGMASRPRTRNTAVAGLVTLGALTGCAAEPDGEGSGACAAVIEYQGHTYWGGANSSSIPRSPVARSAPSFQDATAPAEMSAGDRTRGTGTRRSRLRNSPVSTGMSPCYSTARSSSATVRTCPDGHDAGSRPFTAPAREPSSRGLTGAASRHHTSRASTAIFDSRTSSRYTSSPAQKSTSVRPSCCVLRRTRIRP
jgi:hypothetical protein